jgi:hypothetical protein
MPHPWPLDNLHCLLSREAFLLEKATVHPVDVPVGLKIENKNLFYFDF